ncbi:hypothetical protein GCM10027445_48610 [Amycolatopsis endophytica]|uniref:AcrR family transcriptional regulator n=1 Tax=Amycolatopsis endophytica TaxID=860233 RepID=A0A853BF32_9PSEU|nr:TetR/AcrR family transcriptional regulator [Amycolatopsis endophytica]NYI93375.1 AcrR family transcriptional regulator [Amycolatopsis endophytica]
MASQSPARKPRPGLTPAIITAAGRKLIERDGLEALTMRAVAAELNTAATSLYRHVADREALLLAVLEEVASGLPVDVAGRTPKKRLERRLVATHDYMADHVWVLHILIRGEMVAVNALPFADACIGDFIAAGQRPREAYAAFLACWHLTIGELLDSHPLTPPPQPSQRSRAVAGIDPDELPALAKVRDLGRSVTKDSFPRTIGKLLEALLS